MAKYIEQKVSVFIGCSFFVFLLLIVRLYFLQVVYHDYYTKRSQGNFIQERVIKHNRGKILDSEGRVLVDNRRSYDVFVTFSMMPSIYKTLRQIFSWADVSTKGLGKFAKEVALRAESGEHFPTVVLDRLSGFRCRRLEEKVADAEMSGVLVSYDKRQNYCDVIVDPMVISSEHNGYLALEDYISTRGSLKPAWDKARNASRGLGRFKPTLLLEDIGFEAYAGVENAISLGLLPGITVIPSQRRRYRHDGTAAHLIGFVNQVSLADIKEYQGTYRVGDYIGRKGLESTFENYLRGKDGVEKVVVDARGRRFSQAWEDELLGSQKMRESKGGLDLKLSIDFDLQKSVEELFLGKSGSVVVMDVNSGFLLALASFPGYNPNSIVSADNYAYFSNLLKDPLRTLRNKAVQDHYSPGSVFKPITAISGLNNKLITAGTSHNCLGWYQIHKTRWRCYRRYGHGSLTLWEALKTSCDSYFYELGHRLGLEKLVETSTSLGFGKKTGINLLGESTGLIPSKEYYLKRFGYVAPGFAVNMSIGQGDVSVTPVQMASAYAALVNGGVLYRPQLVKEILSSDGTVNKTFHKEVTEVIAEDKHKYDEILKGLSYVTDEGGSAYSLRWRREYHDIAIWLKGGNHLAGKTGTAQVVKLSKQVDHVKPEDVPYEHRDHAWFVGLYPLENPQIVVVVMTEHAGFGSVMSAPVALRIMKKWQEKHGVKVSL